MLSQRRYKQNFIFHLKFSISFAKAQRPKFHLNSSQEMEMYLPSTFQFQGWDIRYNLTKSTDNISKRQPKCVVFVHGTPWSSAVFRPIISTLLAKGSYQILVYDLPGYSQSQAYTPSNTSPFKAGFPGDTSVKFQAEALTALLSHAQLHCSAPAVIAHDIAGAIALRAHLLHDCDFDSMMLIDTNAVLPWGDGLYKLARSQPQTFLQLPPAIHEAVVRAVIQSACHDPNILKTGWEDVLAKPWIGSEEKQSSFVRQIAQADDGDVREMLEADLYGKVRCDVKIVWGESDQWIPREKIEELVERMGGRVKETTFIPEAGHLVMLDQPGRFAVEISDWLTKFGSERSLVRNGADN